MSEATALRWYSQGPGRCIGFVLVADREVPEPYFKVYIGIGTGFNEKYDTALIAGSGMPLLDEVMARGLAGERAEGLRYAY